MALPNKGMLLRATLCQLRPILSTRAHIRLLGPQHIQLNKDTLYRLRNQADTKYTMLRRQRTRLLLQRVLLQEDRVRIRDVATDQDAPVSPVDPQSAMPPAMPHRGQSNAPSSNVPTKGIKLEVKLEDEDEPESHSANSSQVPQPNEELVRALAESRQREARMLAESREQAARIERMERMMEQVIASNRGGTDPSRPQEGLSEEISEIEKAEWFTSTD
ncbi:hypothetical protein BDV95DRAFT_607646 [Massariosphaeria phaeospora]|uniref:Uncharacterized protein n=1 Tax=Massariosphaeria phaeospora TaxID=100035 RepID=A0A7C8M724_9PLEO|nr:hypothetical protein BDV95DRAFT_607646 [Massariosphaeria phaeospora]